MHDSSLTICSLHSVPLTPLTPASQPASAWQQPEHSSHIWPPTPSQLLALVITHKPRVLLLSPPSLMISPLLGSKPEKYGVHRRHLESRAPPPPRWFSSSGWSFSSDGCLFLLRCMLLCGATVMIFWERLLSSGGNKTNQNQFSHSLCLSRGRAPIVPALQGKHQILVGSQVIVSKRKDFPTFWVILTEFVAEPPPGCRSSTLLKYTLFI